MRFFFGVIGFCMMLMSSTGLGLECLVPLALEVKRLVFFSTIGVVGSILMLPALKDV
jgi:hypothetical protein